MMKQKITAALCALVLLFSAVPGASALEGEAARAGAALTALHVIDSAGDLSAPASRGLVNALLVRLSGLSIQTNTLDAAIDQGWTTVTSGQQEAIPADECFSALLRFLGYSGFPGAAARYARHTGLAVRDYAGPLTLGDRLAGLATNLPILAAVGMLCWTTWKPIVEGVLGR